MYYILRKNGLTTAHKQRWRCLSCGHSFIRKRPDQRARQQNVWFQKWLEGYTISQLVTLSGKSKAAMHRLLLRELAKPVPPLLNLTRMTHLMFDAKYLFGRQYCLLVILDAATNRPVAGTVVRGETRPCITPWLIALKTAGLSPVAVTTDGRQAGIYAFARVWPEITIQRCLFHIRMQVEPWVRAKPKYPAAVALKQLCETLCWVGTRAEAVVFQAAYQQLRATHQAELACLNAAHPVEGELIRAYQLLYYALPNCFHYLEDTRIARTTSPLEGYFKHVQKIRGFQHNGMTEEHLFQFLAWKLYYDGRKKHTK